MFLWYGVAHSSVEESFFWWAKRGKLEWNLLPTNRTLRMVTKDGILFYTFAIDTCDMVLRCSQTVVYKGIWDF